MDQLRIVQIAVGDSGTVHGLGDNNRMYIWNVLRGEWTPNWQNYAADQ